MWSRSLLKQNAKRVLRRRFGVALIACLIWVLLSNEVLVCFVDTGFSHLYIGQGEARPNIGPAYFTVFAVSLSAVLVFRFLVGNVLRVGLARFFMERRKGSAPLSTLFSGFSYQWKNIVAVMLWRDVTVCLWGLLMLVPGVYQAYRYRLVPWLLAENPTLAPRRAMQLSRAATQDEFAPMLLLDFSFIGWFVLGVATCTLGLFFLLPYYMSVWAEFYAAMRAKLFALGASGDNELSGFVQYP